MTKRLDDLEARLMFQDDTISQLNHAIGEQELRVAALERQVALLVEQLRKLVEQGGATGNPEGSDSPPPHY